MATGWIESRAAARAGIAAVLVLAAACAPVPGPAPAEADAPWPRLVPLEEIVAQEAAVGPRDAGAEALARRAEALRRRAEALRARGAPTPSAAAGG